MSRLRIVTFAVILALASAVPAAASETHDYLALGDSVAFGYSPLVVAAGQAGDATSFVGYPEALAKTLPLALTNASCPGEASGGFISLAGTDNGCRGYRFGLGYPLHVAYGGTQLDFAVAYVRAHPRAKLITIDLGANDVFVLERACGGDTSCVLAGLPATLDALRANLATIYAGLRSAGFHGRLVALLYYAENYGDPLEVGVLSALNGTVAGVTLAQPAGAVADGFGAFAAASAPFGGDACAAGLLIALPAGGCDVHPSPRGRDLLAATIREVVRAAGD